MEKYGITHWEKERLVDLFVKRYFEKEMPNYKLQGVADIKIDAYIKDIRTLPDEVEAYKESTKR